MSIPETMVSVTASHSTVRHSHSTSAVTGQTNAPTDSIWKNAFHLPSRTAGREMPFRPGDDPVGGDPHLACRHDRDRHPPDVAAGDQGDEAAECQNLVGDRIEERAGAGGAVTRAPASRRCRR